MSCSKEEFLRVTSADFITRIAESDVTNEDIKRLQVCVLHVGILTQAERLEVSRTLGVLGSILTDARDGSARESLGLAEDFWAVWGCE